MIPVILDLDGIVVRAPWTKLADWEDKADCQHWLHEQSQRGIIFDFSFLTDRPCGNLEPIVYDWHAIYSCHIGESGGAAFDPMRKWQWPNPRFNQFRDEVRPQIIERLRSVIGLGGAQCQEEMGGRMTTIAISFVQPGLVHEGADQAIDALRDQPYFVDLRYEIGKVLVIYPKECDKSTALDWVDEMHRMMHDLPYPWSNAVLIADGKRDIVAAEYVARRGGTVAAVGNADPEYREVVQSLSGIIVDGYYESGLRQILEKFIF